MPSKHKSGCQKRKRKGRENALIQSQAGALNKYFSKKRIGEESHMNVENEATESTELIVDQLCEIEETNENESQEKEDEETRESGESREGCFNIDDLDDPGNWKNIDHKLRDYLVERGPTRDESFVFPKDATKRHFDASYFSRMLPSGQTVDRRWLIYSISKDKVYCFCCKLFPTGDTVANVGLLASDGNKDWHNLGRVLKNHDKNQEHLNCMGRWGDLENRLRRNATIDNKLQVMMTEEKAHWREVLTRIISIVTMLAESTLPFRGDNDTLYAEHNGLFLGLVQMVAKFDPVMKEHIRRATKNEIQFTYLGKTIQNELIQLLASEVRNSIISIIKQAKFFSVILDCTPDASREEQMSLVIRCVNNTSNSVVVEEFWLEFVKVDDTTGLGLFTELEEILNRLDLKIDDIRGQGYDNGSNMSGKYKGVQSRLLEINPRAFYTPCGCHSLNLTLCDMVRCSTRARDFFGVVQKIYTLFSSSTKRWSVFKDRVKGLTVKNLCQTRWESHIESIRPLKEHTRDIIDALLDLAESDGDDSTQLEARAVAGFVANFEFLLSLIIWYKLLFAVNKVSKSLQVEDVDLNVAIHLLEGLESFLKEFRKNGFDIAMKEAGEMAEKLGIEVEFREKRIIRRKKQFDENNSNEVRLSPMESFRVDYFICVVDKAETSLNTRFEHFKKYKETFGFLFDIEKLRQMSYNELEKYCNILEKYLTHEGHSDIDGQELCHELISLREYIPNDIKRAVEVMEFMKVSMNDLFPFSYIAYQIMLTIPITVASAERSFSKLKLIKTYLRSSMSQERLNGLAMLSIEKEMVKKLDCERLISVFASKSARRAIFRNPCNAF